MLAVVEYITQNATKCVLVWTIFLHFYYCINITSLQYTPDYPA